MLLSWWNLPWLFVQGRVCIFSHNILPNRWLHMWGVGSKAISQLHSKSFLCNSIVGNLLSNLCSWESILRIHPDQPQHPKTVLQTLFLLLFVVLQNRKDWFVFQIYKANHTNVFYLKQIKTDLSPSSKLLLLIKYSFNSFYYLMINYFPTCKVLLLSFMCLKSVKYLMQCFLE